MQFWKVLTNTWINMFEVVKGTEDVKHHSAVVNTENFPRLQEGFLFFYSLRLKEKLDINLLKYVKQMSNCLFKTL